MDDKYCLPESAEVKGLGGSDGSKRPIIMISRCRESELPEGELCMGKEELQKYFDGSIFIRLVYSKTFIDFEDI